MDDRTYIRLHDGMPDHPKVAGLSDGAFRLYVESLCWCGRYLTDGSVQAAAMRRMGGWSLEAVDELATAGLIHPADDASQVRSHDVSQNGSQSHPVTWMMHDYKQHQRSAVEVAAIRKAKRSAAVIGNHERWHKARGLPDLDCDLCMAPEASDDASQVRSDTRSDVQSHNASGSDGTRDRKHPRKTSPETETDKELKKKELDQVGSDEDPGFVAFWEPYPRKVGKGQARKAYRSAVLGLHVDPKKITAACERFRDEVRRQRTEAKFIPHPATWLNGERWSDESATSTAGERERNFEF